MSLGASGDGGSTFMAGDGYAFHVTGPEGGPFPDGRRNYWVKNTTDDRVLRWSVSATEEWLKFSEDGGLLGPGARTEVLVKLDDEYAATLPVGDYPADIVFRDARTGMGEVYLSFLLTVVSASATDMVVTPEDDFVTQGPVDGPLQETTKLYWIENTGSEALAWHAERSESWVKFQGPAKGTLLPAEQASLAVAIDPSVFGLGSGEHHATVTFVNEGDDLENVTREVVVTLSGEAGDRVTDGLQLLYDFTEGSGSIVEDHSGVTPPLHLQIADTSRVEWLPGGLRFAQPTIAKAQGDAGRLSQALTANNGLTLEAWIEPQNLTQDGPARIMTLSNGSSLRNFTLGQGLWGGQASDTFNVRLRTTNTDDDGMPLLTTAAGAAKQGVQHLVYTRDASGTARIYVDGNQVASGSVGGNLSNWNASYGFALGNEIGASRPWLGTMHLAAVYDRPLTASEVEQNYLAGPGESDAGRIDVNPYSDVTITATEGLGDWSSTSAAYTLSNPGTEQVAWHANLSEAWTFLTTDASGTLNPGQQAEVGLALDTDAVRSFTPGTYTSTLTLSNDTNGWGSTTRHVILIVKPEGGGGGGGGGYDDERPGPTNTGPYDESILVPTGSITVTQDGAVIENVRVSGGITVKANNVTIRNFIVDGQMGTYYGVYVPDGYQNTLVEDGEIVRTTSAGVFGKYLTARRLEIHEQGADGFKCEGYNLVEGCWIHHLGINDGAHADGNQSRVGANITFRGNFFDMPSPSSPNGPPPPYKSNACSINQATLYDISNLVMDSNWLNGGGYTVYFTAPTQYGYSNTNGKLINNRFGRDFEYGPLYVTGNVSGLQISGNVWDDTGDLMDIND